MSGCSWGSTFCITHGVGLIMYAVAIVQFVTVGWVCAQVIAAFENTVDPMLCAWYSDLQSTILIDIELGDHKAAL